jgi:mRNA-degrading endonuclease toxin of MazEF toxin-antitoxin module
MCFAGGDILQYIINGGIYRVVFKGTHGAEFSGEHPALIIRTLKENEIYKVIPLTTYTREKMEKARTKGFGMHIQSTNSIARIDKYQIIHKSDIKNKWRVGSACIKVTPDELKNLNDKINEYVRLSNEKTHKEYVKYYDQYKSFDIFLSCVYKGQQNVDTIFIVEETENTRIIKCKKSEIYWLSRIDIEEIVSQYYKLNTTINIIDDNLIIEIKQKKDS